MYYLKKSFPQFLLPEVLDFTRLSIYVALNIQSGKSRRLGERDASLQLKNCALYA